ncbi:Hint domain-containing protein [Marivita sp.]|uniref:Hint domain-containing protein n=1 Tax=Marivita sp. TaxID=2003365 RepID=UPI003F6D7E13
MATIYDLIEVTNISANTTYSAVQGNYIGVVDGMVSTALDDGEFDQGDVVTIGGTDYTIDLIQEPSNSGRFTLTDGTNLSFNPQSETNLDAVFLTVSDGVNTRYFIIANDSYGDMSIDEIRTGSLTDVGGSDAAIISTTNNSVSVVCFANGTLIECADGRIAPVETLKVGDAVKTLDHDPQKISSTGFRSVGSAQMFANLSREDRAIQTL